ncbi:phosphoenolpyruvate synthase [Bdellovibrio bacteriovorus]|uniref:phosphoenolpyruvate synthase n=1 Tax=Bdellovibrio TaxID=958 RepID=UPI0035A86017
MKRIFTPQDSLEVFKKSGGGKAYNMARLTQKGVPVPDWFCVSAEAYEEFISSNSLNPDALIDATQLAKSAENIEAAFLKAQIPAALTAEIEKHLAQAQLTQHFVAVRSSGLDEDSAQNSFAGQFSSYLFQKGMDAISVSLKKCWASAFSERALAYRIERKIGITGISMGVIIQKMVNADVAGVAFSRNPIKALDRDHLLVSSVWGLGEGLVSGELDADHYEVHRNDLTFKPHIVDKPEALRQAPEGGLVKVHVNSDLVKTSSLTDAQVKEVAKLALELEKKFGASQDCEWAFENNKLYCVQTRPITSLPPDEFFDVNINGGEATLWDNSNIIESYSGVTSPLTFSFASQAYRQVYIQFCEVIGVPKHLIIKNEKTFRNMLGLIRGNIYYNLINWYKLILMLPGSGDNKAFMETMMGVKQGLKPEFAHLFDFMKTPVRYSPPHKAWLLTMTLWRFMRINSIVTGFQSHFTATYNDARKKNFRDMSLNELREFYEFLDGEVLRNWKAPIINDYLCMVFFGLLKKLTEKWVAEGNDGASLQNDLLCGQGDLESTEPTKTLMRIAAFVDKGDPALREWVLSTPIDIAWKTLLEGKHPQFKAKVDDFLDKYGFRCINELKLEAKDLHDDPTFALGAIQSYVRMKSYDIEEMEKRELEIRHKAEALINQKLSGFKLWFYFKILNQARKAVRNRENLRFARTKIFGIARHLFRGIGHQLTRLGQMEQEEDIFFLTVEEIMSFIEGRAVSLEIKKLIELRKIEFKEYEDSLPPPDRFMTFGAAGVACKFPQALSDGDLLRGEIPQSDDPNVLYGVPCCPGVIEGVVRVVNNMKDAEGLNGEILVTGRTDPGWVPLYPSCSGLLIERGSLLSHSAVVARELGLPTIVGVSGGLMTKLKTGQRVRIDAGKGEIRILVDE